MEWVRIGRYLPGITPDVYRRLSHYDKLCLHDALDTLLERENEQPTRPGGGE
jgi:hypothetical protein